VAETTGVSIADKLKISVAVLLVAAGIVGFYQLAESPLVVRVLAVLAGVAAAAAVGWFTVPGKDFVAFSKESAEETKRVVWPTRKETLQTTGIVLAFVVVMAVFLWLVDAGLALALRLLMGQGDA
jgi:preprotein translocase subunit SecE